MSDISLSLFLSLRLTRVNWEVCKVTETDTQYSHCHCVSATCARRCIFFICALLCSQVNGPLNAITFAHAHSHSSNAYAVQYNLRAFSKPVHWPCEELFHAVHACGHFEAFVTRHSEFASNFQRNNSKTKSYNKRMENNTIIGWIVLMNLTLCSVVMIFVVWVLAKKLKI